MSKQRKSFPLRISEELFDEIKAWAEQDMRSVNAQIEYVLKLAATKRRSRGSSERENEIKLRDQFKNG